MVPSAFVTVTTLPSILAFWPPGPCDRASPPGLQPRRRAPVHGEVQSGTIDLPAVAVSLSPQLLVKPTRVTGWPRSTTTGSNGWTTASQMRAVPSSPAVTISRPVGVNSAELRFSSLLPIRSAYDPCRSSRCSRCGRSSRSRPLPVGAEPIRSRVRHPRAPTRPAVRTHPTRGFRRCSLSRAPPAWAQRDRRDWPTCPTARAEAAVGRARPDHRRRRRSRSRPRAGRRRSRRGSVVDLEPGPLPIARSMTLTFGGGCP